MKVLRIALIALVLVAGCGVQSPKALQEVTFVDQLSHLVGQLKKEEQKFRTIFDEAEVGIVVVDQHERIVEVNEAGAATRSGVRSEPDSYALIVLCSAP